MVFVVADAAECHARTRRVRIRVLIMPSSGRWPPVASTARRSVENRGGIAMFRERTRREIWSWLDRLPAVPPFP
jgi:hypothetical protein